MTFKRWLTLKAEADFILYQLEKMHEEAHKPKAPIEAMIDESTGFHGKELKRAKILIRKFKKFRTLLTKGSE